MGLPKVMHRRFGKTVWACSNQLIDKQFVGSYLVVTKTRVAF